MSITDDLLTLLMGKVNGEGGGDKPLTPLTNPALAENILAGKEAYNGQKEVLTGSLTVADLLAALTNPAAAGDLLAGKEAYNDQGVKLVGSLTVADLLAALNTPASAGDIAAGKEAYDDEGNVITGTAIAGNPEAQSNDVNYYDYDGTIRYSYSAEDFLALASHPANPNHRGLVAQGWNWPLAEAKSYVSKYGMLNVGQMYITDDGKTRITFRVTSEYPDVVFTLYKGTGSVESIEIDWGDGSSESKSAPADYEVISSSHSYATAGDYVVSIKTGELNTTDLQLGYHNVASTSVTSMNTAFGNFRVATDNKQMASKVVAVSIGSGITLGETAFRYLTDLQYVTIPRNGLSNNINFLFANNKSTSHVTLPICDNHDFLCGAMLENATCVRSVALPYTGAHDSFISGHTNFASNAAIERITFPEGFDYPKLTGLAFMKEIVAPEATSIPSLGGTLLQRYVAPAATTMYGAFMNSPVKKFSVPEGVTSIGGIFQNCSQLATITLPAGLTSIGAQCFYYCTSLKEVHFKSTTPPTVANSNAWGYISKDCVFYVPHGSLEAYTTATNYPSSSTYTYVEED